MLSKNVRRAIAGARALLLQPERRFWLIVGLITLGGAILRVLIHDYGLPYIEEVDELRIWFMARDARGVPMTVGTRLDPTYPPLIIWMHQLVQPLSEAQGRPLAVHAILDIRRVMLFFNVLGTFWFAMLGRRCGGALAGVIAAALWAFATFVPRTTVFAIGESLAIPLLVLSLLLALQALESARRWWLALVSMALGVLCFFGDYRLLVAVVPGFVALLWHLWRHFRPGRLRLLLWSSAGIALSVTVAAWILARLPQRFQTLAQAMLSNYLWDFDAFSLLLRRSIAQLHPVSFLLLLLLVLVALRSRYAPAAAPASRPALLMAGTTLILATWAASAIRPYGQDSLQRIWSRHLLPMVLMLYLLLATAIAQLFSVVREARVRKSIYIILVVYLLLFLLLPARSLVNEYRVLPWPAVVRAWVDDNLESSTILVYPSTERWFDPFVGGMPHRVWFDWWKVRDLRDYSLEELIETNRITWALIPYNERSLLTRSVEGRELLEQMLLVREFTAPPSRRREETFFYRLWRMQQETDIHFGDHIRLVGYDLHTTVPRPGEDLDVTFYWNAASTPTENYSFFLHLVGAAGASPLAQVDGNPAIPVRLTQTWDRPEETLISPRFSLSLPPDLAPGDYRVLLGLYNFETGARLPLRDAQDVPRGDAWELLRLNIADDGTATVTETILAP